ncbi:MAG TPA: saccharopine dehydrogenase NADP-binding domain-containing protein [Actinomycetota bacterium]|nr:saccharopine dehydrogenase NADP-binding domain-containing protein [Actinomycetota bacterium]
MRALILGATGAIGRTVAAELARSTEVERLWLAGRNEARLAWLVDVLSGDPSRISAHAFDLHDGALRDRRFRELSPDLVISCVGPAGRLELPCARAAVEVGASWLSSANDHAAAEAVPSLHASAVTAGVTVVSGCGLSPGLTNLLVALAAQELDEVEEIEIATARSARDPAGQAALAALLVGLSGPAPSIADGRRTSEPGPKASHLVYFPEPVGWIETFAGASPEITTLPSRWPGLRLLRWRVGLVEKPAMDALRLLAGGPWASRLANWGPVGSRALQQALGAWPSAGPAWSAARVDVRGRAGAHPRSISLGVVDHLVNLTALPLVAAATELAAGRTEPGVRAPEQAFEPKSLLARIGRRGVRIARLEPYLI